MDFVLLLATYLWCWFLVYWFLNVINFMFFPMCFCCRLERLVERSGNPFPKLWVLLSLIVFVWLGFALWNRSDALLSHSNFQEKAPYEAKAAKRKAEYEKLMTAYLKKQVNALFLHDCTLNLIVRMLAWAVSQSPASFDLIWRRVLLTRMMKVLRSRHLRFMTMSRYGCQLTMSFCMLLCSLFSFLEFILTSLMRFWFKFVIWLTIWILLSQEEDEEEDEGDNDDNDEEWN